MADVESMLEIVLALKKWIKARREYYTGLLNLLFDIGGDAHVMVKLTRDIRAWEQVELKIDQLAWELEYP